jgi:hypothetical protein
MLLPIFGSPHIKEKEKKIKKRLSEDNKKKK